MRNHFFAMSIPLLFVACDQENPVEAKSPDMRVLKQRVASEMKQNEVALAAAREEVEMLRNENLRLETELSAVRLQLEQERSRIESARALGKAEATLEVLKSSSAPAATTYMPSVPTPVERAAIAASPTMPAKDEHPIWKTYQGVGVMRTIRAEAEKRWGTNYTMVEFSIKEQKEAFEQLLEYKKTYNRVTKGIIADAEMRWGSNYTMVVYQVKEQLGAKNRLDGR